MKQGIEFSVLDFERPMHQQAAEDILEIAADSDGFVLPLDLQDMKAHLLGMIAVDESGRGRIYCAVKKLYTPALAELGPLIVVPEERGNGLAADATVAVVNAWSKLNPNGPKLFACANNITEKTFGSLGGTVIASKEEFVEMTAELDPYYELPLGTPSNTVYDLSPLQSESAGK